MSTTSTVASFPVQYQGISISQSILSRIPYALAVEYFALPISLDPKGRIQALMAYPNDSETLQQLQIASDCSIRPIECPKEELLKLIAKHYGVNGEQANKKASGLQTSTLGTPQHQRLSVNPADSTINLVNDIVHEAIRLRASDIHFEPFEREMLVRFRVDGVLQEMVSVPLDR